MKIYIKKLTLLNFKGIRSLTVPFTHETNIFGQNASGKTTVFDAFTWLLFGKDSTDRKDFNIKTLDKNNSPISKLTHEVNGILNVDGTDINLKHTYQEKWVKKRGEETSEFSGHLHEYFYNSVPLSEAEYKDKIGAILKESIFKLITNALYFNSMKWQDRRNVLLELAGPVSNEMIVDSLKGSKNDKGYDNLLFILQSGKSLEEYRREIGAKKKIIKNDIILIPSRIDEVKRGMPDEVDYGAIQKVIEKLQADIERAEAAISNKNEAYQKEYKIIQEKQSKLHQHKSRRQEIMFGVRQSIAGAHADRNQGRSVIANKIGALEQDLQSKQNLLASSQKNKIRFLGELDALRLQWKAINAEELKFNDSEFHCPACKREFEAGDVAGKKQELLNNFNENKSRRLSANRQSGTETKAEADKCDAQIDSLTIAITHFENELADQRSRLEAFDKENTVEVPPLDDQLAANDEYVQLGSTIAALEAEVNKGPEVNDAELKQQRTSLILQRDAEKAKLNDKVVRERALARIKELEGEEKSMAQEIARLEQTEFLADGFTKAKMNVITDRVNGLFKLVKFKLFETQINGGETEACETLIGGVPFSDANNAARINAGLDIINVLSDHYGVWAPIFIDNRESVTDLIESQSQIINLVLVKGANLSVNEIEYAAGEMAAA